MSFEEELDKIAKFMKIMLEGQKSAAETMKNYNEALKLLLERVNGIDERLLSVERFLSKKGKK